MVKSAMWYAQKRRARLLEGVRRPGCGSTLAEKRPLRLEVGDHAKPYFLLGHVISKFIAHLLLSLPGLGIGMAWGGSEWVGVGALPLI